MGIGCREGGMRGRLKDKGWGGRHEESTELKIDIYLLDEHTLKVTEMCR